MQYVLLALLSILWKLAVLPVVIAVVARVLRQSMLRRARVRHPTAWRIDVKARAAERDRARLWQLGGMGVLVLDAEALRWRRLWPGDERTVAVDEIEEAFAVGEGKAALLRIQARDGRVHLWRVPDADAWAEELRGREAR